MARYYRFVGWLPGSHASAVLGALQLLDSAGARVDVGATITASVAPVSGSLAALGNVVIGAGCTFNATDMRAAGFWITIDCGADVAPTALRVGAATGSSSAQWPLGCVVLASNDALSWSFVAAVSTDRALAWPGAGAAAECALWLLAAVPPVLAMACDTVAAVDVTGRSAPVLVGAAARSAAQSVSGGYSYRVPGDGSAIRVPVATGSPLLLGAGDFTVHMRVRLSTAAGVLMSWGYIDGGAWGDVLVTTRAGSAGKYKIAWYIKSNGASSPDIANNQISAAEATLGQWCTLILKRSGNAFTLAVDGVTFLTVNSALALGATVNAAGVCFGGSLTSTGSTNNGIDGYIDDIAVINGAAVALPAVLPWRFDVAARAPQLGFSAARVAASAPAQAFCVRGSRAAMARDVEFGGTGRIWGTTKTELSATVRVPTKARVSLLRGRDMLLARQVWSDSTGAFEFRGLDTAQEFVTVAEDSAGSYRPVGANKTLPGAA